MAKVSLADRLGKPNVEAPIAFKGFTSTPPPPCSCFLYLANLLGELTTSRRKDPAWD